MKGTIQYLLLLFLLSCCQSKSQVTDSVSSQSPAAPPGPLPLQPWQLQGQSPGPQLGSATGQPWQQPPQPLKCKFGECRTWTMSVVLLFSNSMKESVFFVVRDFLDNIINSCDLSKGQIKAAYFGPNSTSELLNWITTEEQLSAMDKKISLKDYVTDQTQNITLFNTVIEFAANETDLFAKNMMEGKYLLLLTDIALAIAQMENDTLTNNFNAKAITAKGILMMDFDDGAVVPPPENQTNIYIDKGQMMNDSLPAYFVALQALSPCGGNATNFTQLMPFGGKNGPLLPPPPPPPPFNWVLTVSIIVGVLLLVCLLAATFIIYSGTKFHWKAKIEKFRSQGRKTSQDNAITATAPSNDYEKLEEHDDWLIPQSNLVVFYDQQIGAGAFSRVFKGKLSGAAPVCKIHPSVQASRSYTDCVVAIKMLPNFADDSAKVNFVQEINFMKTLDYHPHLVCILGTSFDNNLDFLVIEYCVHGDLLHYIRKHREEILNEHTNLTGLKVKDLMCYAWQISDGMDYLSSKGYMHRDLAARNILVDHANTAKISDFGLCRIADQTVYMAGGGRLPIKWMAIESLKCYEYTCKSDIWSYGVLLYEVFSLGEAPFVRVQPADMIDHLDADNRLPQPELCSNEMYSIMKTCWLANPDLRPTFDEIRNDISKILECATESYGYLPVKDERRSLSVLRSASEHSDNEYSHEKDGAQSLVFSLTSFHQVAV